MLLQKPQLCGVRSDVITETQPRVKQDAKQTQLVVTPDAPA